MYLDLLRGARRCQCRANPLEKLIRTRPEIIAARTLTVGENNGFAEQGGIINLTVEQNKVHLEVNQLAAARAGLKISAKLLSVAKTVKESG